MTGEDMEMRRGHNDHKLSSSPLATLCRKLLSPTKPKASSAVGGGRHQQKKPLSNLRSSPTNNVQVSASMSEFQCPRELSESECVNLVPESSCSRSSSSSQDQMWKVFDYFDENGDGKISPAELQNCVRHVGGQLSDEEAEAAVVASDLDGDGLLGFEEFHKLMEATNDEDKNKELRDAFGMYEMEGSGSITPSSLKRMLARLGDSRSVDDCKAMISKFDINGDGVLSFHEFTIMMR